MANTTKQVKMEEETLKIEIPTGFMNTGISSNGKVLIADTNDSSNWQIFKHKLPDGNWKIKNIANNTATVINQSQ